MSTSRQKIVPHLWFDKEAKEAAAFYTAAFPDSRITGTTTVRGTPSGDCDVVSFELGGYGFMAISAGPHFRINPSISFMLNFDPARDPNARANLDALWDRLSDGGMALMPLDRYPFSERYGWIQDKFGVSWQLFLTNPGGEERPFIVPSLLFVGEVCGRAEEAIDCWLTVFGGSRKGHVAHYGKGQEPDREGTLMFGDFMLGNQWFAAMDSAHAHQFAFNEAVSLLVNCATQDEIDYYWERLSAAPDAGQCGWLKDRFGVSWQISAAELDDMLRDGTERQVDSVMQAMQRMKKLNLAALREAYSAAS